MFCFLRADRPLSPAIIESLATGVCELIWNHSRRERFTSEVCDGFVSTDGTRARFGNIVGTKLELVFEDSRGVTTGIFILPDVVRRDISAKIVSARALQDGTLN